MRTPQLASVIAISFAIFATGTIKATWGEIPDPVSEKCKAHNHLPGPFCEDDFELIDGCCVKCTKCFAGYGKPATSRDQALCTDKCVPCIDGNTFSESESTLQCRKCTDCGHPLLNRQTAKPCNRLSDTKCGACKYGFYDPSSDGDTREACWMCKPGILGCVDEVPPLKTDAAHTEPQKPSTVTMATASGASDAVTKTRQPRSTDGQPGQGVNSALVMAILSLFSILALLVIVALMRRGYVYSCISDKCKKVRERREHFRGHHREMSDVQGHTMVYMHEPPQELTAVNLTLEGQSARSEPGHGHNTTTAQTTPPESDDNMHHDSNLNMASMVAAHCGSTTVTTGGESMLLDESTPFCSEVTNKQLNEEQSWSGTTRNMQGQHIQDGNGDLSESANLLPGRDHNLCSSCGQQTHLFEHF